MEFLPPSEQAQGGEHAKQAKDMVTVAVGEQYGLEVGEVEPLLT